MIPPPLERNLEQRLVALCRRRGVYCRKFVAPSQRGVPDRILIRSGKVVFLELKREGQEPTPTQRHEIGLLQKAGANAYWAAGAQNILAFMDEHFPDVI